MNLVEKLEVAQLLADMGVDIIEAGFPIASPGDFESVKQIAQTVRGSTICGLARCNDKDIDTAWEAVKYAPQARIHVFLATSAIHREFKLRMTPDEISGTRGCRCETCRELLRRHRVFSRGCMSSEHDFLCRVVEAAIDAGATTVNIPDTVGYATPDEIYTRFKMLRDRVPNIDKAVLSTHCHDDLGLAVANSLAAVAAAQARSSARLTVSVNELARVLEEVVMAMKTRSDFYRCRTY